MRDVALKIAFVFMAAFTIAAAIIESYPEQVKCWMIAHGTPMETRGQACPK